MYHPEISYPTRVISIAWLFPIVGFLALIPILVDDVILKGQIEVLMGDYGYILVLGVGSLFLSYGLSHLRKWSLFLFPALLLFLFIATGGIYLGPMGLIGYLIVLMDYKKFR